MIGQRILIIGNSCSEKSTLGSNLASVLNVPFLELDALNWEPNWVGLNDTNPDELLQRIRKATAGCSWVVAGSSQPESTDLRLLAQYLKSALMRGWFKL